MERKLLFSLTLLKVSGKNRFVYTSDVKQAVRALQQLSAFMIEKIEIINFYEDGFEKVPESLKIYFAEFLDYQKALKKAKSDKRIIIPEQFLYDKKKYLRGCFVYSAKLKKIEMMQDDGGPDLIVEEQVLENILQGSTVYNQFHLDILNDDEKKKLDRFFLFESKEFALGNGKLTFYSEEDRSFHSILTEFKNNLIEYSFIRVCDVKYRMDGSVKYCPENDLFIFRDDCRLSCEKALEYCSNKKLVQQLIEKGQKDFIIDKKYDDIFPAPKNSFFVPVTTIYNKWDI